MALGNTNNTIKTRIQLKSDTEENWNKSVLIEEGGTKAIGTSFVPLPGELIVYIPDATHHFSRLKVGDGHKNVVQLPFVDTEFSVTRVPIQYVTNVRNGTMTMAEINNSVLQINNGISTRVDTLPLSVITDITHNRGGDTE